MAEWSKAPVLKTGDVKASVGSNPTLSAKPHYMVLQKYPSGRRGSPAKGVGGLKTRARVRLPPSAPKREAKKDIEDKTSVFSRLPRPVDQQIYGPYFSDILPCAIHSGRSRTHTIFTLSGISFEAGILLLQDLGLFYSAVETDSPNRKPENKRM